MLIGVDKMNCIFCKIINGEIPSYKIYEDETVLVFLDINPDTNGHTLVIPKMHYQDIFDIDKNTLSHILDVATKIMKVLEEKLHCDGFTLVQNNGIVEEVKHFHLHIKPVYQNEENLILLPVEDIYNKITKEDN